MGNGIPPVAWIIVAVLVVAIISINIALIAAFLSRNRPPTDSLPASRSERLPFSDLPETIRHPWHREDEMLEELAQRVKDMQKPENK